MGDRPTLILTTRLGVRPLGVRGDPLHAVANQLLAVIRRRLGDGPADLLAEPQLRETGDGIDWYAARSGPVRRLADFVYVVDGQPVIAAWGYEADAAASLQAFAPPPTPMSPRPAAILASAPVL